VRLLSDISSRAIIVEDMTDFLNECLWVMGHALDVGGVYVWQYDAQTRTFSNIAEWMPEDVAAFKETLQHIPEDIAPWFTSALRQNRTILIPDTQTIPDPEVRSIVLSMGIQSVLVIPIHVKTRLFGFLGFEEYDHCRKWAEEDIRMLKSVAQILARAIENKHIEEELADYRNNLAAKVEERTLELQAINRRLAQEIEARKKVEVTLIERDKALSENAQRLEEANTALRVVLQQVQAERRKVEQIAYQNLKALIGPKIGLLRQSGLNKRQQSCLTMIEKNIQCLFVPETCSLSDQLKCLTPNELNVADMIRQGKTSKEIAALMALSIRTVEVYRYHIRKKLGLTKRKINLRTHLLEAMPSE
jgi:DNA-binding CsgD family transcriptional regulator